MVDAETTKQPASSISLTVSKQSAEGFVSGKTLRLNAIRQRLIQKPEAGSVLQRTTEKIRFLDKSIQDKYGAPYIAARIITIGVGQAFAAKKIGVTGLTAFCSINAMRTLSPMLLKAKKETEEGKATCLFDYMKSHKTEASYCLGGATITGSAEVSNIAGSAVVLSTLRMNKNKGKIIPVPRNSYPEGHELHEMKGWGSWKKAPPKASDQIARKTTSNAKEEINIPATLSASESIKQRAFSTPPQKNTLPVSMPVIGRKGPNLEVDYQKDLFSPDPDLDRTAYEENNVVFVSKFYIKSEKTESIQVSKQVDGKLTEQFYNETISPEGGKYIVVASNDGEYSDTSKYITPDGHEIVLDEYTREAYNSANRNKAGQLPLSEKEKAENRLHKILTKKYGSSMADNIVEARSRFEGISPIVSTAPYTKMGHDNLVAVKSELIRAGR